MSDVHACRAMGSDGHAWQMRCGVEFSGEGLLVHTFKKLNITLAARDARPPIGVGLGPFC